MSFEDKNFDFPNNDLFQIQDYLLEKNIGINLRLDKHAIQSDSCSNTNKNNFLMAFYNNKKDKIDFNNNFSELQTSSNHVCSMRSYSCDFEGCNRSFTSSHGLKYHKKHGHIEFKTFERRPYICQVPGCTKSYKNNNGLKYHIIHAHPDLDLDINSYSQ